MNQNAKQSKANFKKKRALKHTVAIKDFSAPHVQLKVALQMHLIIAFPGVCYERLLILEIKPKFSTTNIWSIKQYLSITSSSIHIKWLHGKFELFKWERSETLKPALHWCCSTSYSLSLIHNLSNTRILCSLPNLPAKHKFCDFLPDDLGFSSHNKKRLVAQKLWYPKHFFSWCDTKNWLWK